MMFDEGLIEQVSEQSFKKDSAIINGHFTLLLYSFEYSKCTAYLFTHFIILQLQKQAKIIYLRIRIDFDLIFQLLRQKEGQSKKINGLPLGIRLQKYDKFLDLMSPQNTLNLFHWRNHLSTKLNQKGFHQLFKPIKKIGKGNFASVYLVTKHEDQNKYAVKAFSKQGTFSEDKGKQSLINQIQIMRKLNHKNLMKIYQIYESQNSIYIVVELLEGGQLYDKIKSKYSFTSSEIKTIMKGLLQGLVSMHQQGIMHRDLKPQNVIFRKEGEWDCVIADFGLATHVNEKEYIYVRCGTPGYVAPQVVNLKDNEAKYQSICDLFSLGVIFHILTLKTSPFPGRQYNEVLLQNKNCIIDFSLDQYKKIPKVWLNLLMQLLEKDPSKRITAAEALNHQFFIDHTLQKKHVKIISEDKILQVSSQQPDKNSIQCESPLMTTRNNQRKKKVELRDDSCLKFKMKENMMTGSIDSNQQGIQTIESPVLAKTKISRCPKSRFKTMVEQNQQ